MKSHIQKWGNSYAFRIPTSIADKLDWKEGTRIEATVQDGKLVIETITVPDYDLNDLLKDMTPKDFHGEVDTGLPLGKEVW